MAHDTVPMRMAPRLRHALQETRFTGSLRIEGRAVAEAEVLKFEDGLFSSRVCLTYGYAPVPYWVRRGPKGLHFLARLDHPEMGAIRFTGVFDGTRMHATARWRKDRWYWNVEQTLVFESAAFERAP